MTADIEELSDKTDGEQYVFEVSELPADKIKNVTSDKLTGYKMYHHAGGHSLAESLI